MDTAIDFDMMNTGAAPSGWVCGVTGKGSPRWTIELDPSAPGAHRVLQQSGSGTFPWCVLPEAGAENGFVEVRMKPLSGREDQAGGVVWRWKDGDNYYVARANAMENNVSLYYTVGGSRKTIKYVDAPVARGKWQVLRVEFSGTKIRVLFDGIVRIEMDDAHIAGAGGVGVWTKADSVTAFDGFRWGRR